MLAYQLELANNVNIMPDLERQDEWPTQLAVLHNGDGLPPYYRPRELDEGLDEFVNRIASIVVAGIVRNPHTAFVEIMDGGTATTDEKLTDLVTESMKKLRS